MAFTATQNRIKRIREAAENLPAVLASKSNVLIKMAIDMGKARFVNSEAVPGQKWAPLSEATSDWSKGRRNPGDKPLWDTGRMINSVGAHIEQAALYLGSSLKDIAPAQHFGRAAKSKADKVKAHKRRMASGKTVDVSAHMRDRNAIPARPIGFDADTSKAMTEIIKTAVMEGV